MDASRQPSNFSKFTDELRRAFQEYLSVPTVIILVFLALAAVMIAIEKSEIAAVDRLRVTLTDQVFGDGDSTRDILTAAAATLITITSITFTVLLLAVQQAAGAMGTQIIDQFLRRPINQLVFGYFVGMSIYSLIVLAAVHEEFNPILSTLLAFVFSGVALYLLAALVYVTLTQMRPAIVIHAIHDGTLVARKRQLPIIMRTRRSPRINDGGRIAVHSRGDGYVGYVDLDLLDKAIGGRRQDLEIVLQVQIGSYVALGDAIAEIRTLSDIDTAGLQEAIRRAVKLGRARDLQYDPLHGIEQIVNIGWTTISTAQQSPIAGAQAIDALRDLLAVWSGNEEGAENDEKLPIVYRDDIPSALLRAFESLAVAAGESRQHQNFALVLLVFAKMFERLPPAQRSLAEAIVPRILSGMGELVLTTELDEALMVLAAALDTAGSGATAEVVRQARDHAHNKPDGRS